MITTMYTLGVIFIMIGVYLGIEMIRQLVITENAAWLFLLFFAALFFAFGIGFVCEEPTNSDVLKGKAHYNKVVTYDGDKETVTYKIEWNDKTRH